jgi:hypothetical protein
MIFTKIGTCYDPFLKVLEQHGRATAEADCADVISTLSILINSLSLL